MRRTSFAIASLPLLSCVFALLATAVSCDQKPPQPKSKVAALSEKKKQADDKDLLLSETLGNFIGQTLKNPSSGITVDLESLITGIRNGFDGQPAPLSEEEYEKIIVQKEEEDFEKQSEENLKAANEFMLGNTGETIIVLIPGKIHYEILHKGKESPTITEKSTPSIHYKGMLLDGTVFGTTEQTGPINISLDSMIPGFKKGIIGMSEGEKRRLYIHPEMAYGMAGELPPNSLLIFEVAVVDADTTHQEDEYEIVEDSSFLDGEEREDTFEEQRASIEPMIEEEPVAVNVMEGAFLQLSSSAEAFIKLADEEEFMSSLPMNE